MIFFLVLCLTLTNLPQPKLTRLIHQHQVKVGVDLRTAEQQSQELAEPSNISK